MDSTLKEAITTLARSNPDLARQLKKAATKREVAADKYVKPLQRKLVDALLELDHSTKERDAEGVAENASYVIRTTARRLKRLGMRINPWKVVEEVEDFSYKFDMGIAKPHWRKASGFVEIVTEEAKQLDGEYPPGHAEGSLLQELGRYLQRLDLKTGNDLEDLGLKVINKASKVAE